MNRARWVGLALALLLGASPLREWLVSTMTGHMLVQIPLLVLAGVLQRSSDPVRESAFNPGGAPGLLVSAAVLTTWMIPRALDLAVTSATAAHFESVSLFACGMLLRCSWHRAGAIGQAFLVGNLTWMAAVAGLLLRDAPVRLCTAYLERDQYVAGTGLLLLVTALSARWFTRWLALPASGGGAAWRTVP